MELNLRVLPLKECNSDDPDIQSAINRMITGPLDVYTGKGFHPAHLIRNADEYYLLADQTTIVGFCSSVYEENTSTLLLKEFEIFHEHRGYSWGKVFAQYLFKNAHLIASGNEPEHFELYEIMTDAWMFWWRSLGGLYFVKQIADVIGAQSAHGLVDRSRFDKWVILRKHKEQKNTYFFLQAIRKLLEKPWLSLSSIVEQIEEMDEFKNLKLCRHPTPPMPPSIRMRKLSFSSANGVQTADGLRPHSPYPTNRITPLLSWTVDHGL